MANPSDIYPICATEEYASILRISVCHIAISEPYSIPNTEKTPSNIAKDSGIKINHISNVLRQLKECEVAVCLNEDAHKNRIYKLTEVGEEVAKHIDNF